MVGIFRLVGAVLAAVTMAAAPAGVSTAGVRASTTTAGELIGVSCASSTSCMAVGGRAATSSGPGGSLAEHWTGTKWSVVSSPNPAGSHGTSLDGVACPSTKDCIAVGSFSGPSGPAPVSERWNGTKWSLVTVPTPSGSTRSNLFGVACVSAADCWAAGGSATNTLIEHWNGSKWSIVASPSVSTDSFLSGVACASASDCWAVGLDFIVSEGGTLTEHWNGSKWATVKTPTSDDGQLLGDACASTTSCMSVGISDSLVSLAQHWSGTAWAVTPTPNPAGAASAELEAAACPQGSSICLAVGNYSKSSTTFTLAERWNGSKWSLTASPSVSGAAVSLLSGVACTTSKNCWAVGQSVKTGQTSTTLPLFERWNGSKWATVS